MTTTQNKIITTTTETVPGRQIANVLGVVRGNSVRAKHIGKDIIANLKHLVGGEIKGYSKMISESRDEAFDRMVKEAADFGADAIVCIRFTTSSVMASASKVLAYGTAVKLSEK